MRMERRYFFRGARHKKSKARGGRDLLTLCPVGERDDVAKRYVYFLHQDGP